MNKYIVFIILLLFSFYDVDSQILIRWPPNNIPCDTWNNQISSSEPNCRNIGCDDPNALWQVGNKIVEIPDWPGCHFDVWFCYRVCSQSNPRTVQVSIFYWYRNPTPCPECQPYDIWMNSDRELNTQIMGIKLWEQITLELYQDHYQVMENNNALHTLYCPNNKTEYMSTKAACKAYCFYQKFNEDDGVFVDMTEVAECNQGSCCVYSRKYCVDQNTHEIIIEGTDLVEEIIDEVGYCSDQIQVQFSTDCYNGFNQSIIECEYKCVEPE